MASDASALPFSNLLDNRGLDAETTSRAVWRTDSQDLKPFSQESLVMFVVFSDFSICLSSANVVVRNSWATRFLSARLDTDGHSALAEAAFSIAKHFFHAGIDL